MAQKLTLKQVFQAVAATVCAQFGCLGDPQSAHDSVGAAYDRVKLEGQYLLFKLKA